MSRLLRLSLFVAVVLGVGLVFSQASGAVIQADQATQVTIGAVYPLTGANATPGTDMERGSQLALAEINVGGYALARLKPACASNIQAKALNQPGVLGKPLKILFGDGQSEPTAAVNATHKLVDVNKVPLVLGAYSSGSSLPMGQYTNAQHVIQISIGSSSPALRDVGPYFFDMLGLDNLMGAAIGKFAMEDSGAKTFASITVNNPFGIGIELQACKYIEDHGGKCVDRVRYDRFKTDYKPELQRLFSHEPQAILFTAYGTESKLILEEAHQLGLVPPKGWYADYMTMWAHDVIPATAEGIKGLLAGAEPPTAYISEYVKKYGEQPLTVWGGYAYDGTWITAMAVNYAGTTDPNVLKYTIPNVAACYQGVTGDKTMDLDGMQQQETYRHGIFRDGKIVPYDPQKYGKW